MLSRFEVMRFHWRRCAKIDNVILPIFSVAKDFREGEAPKR